MTALTAGKPEDVGLDPDQIEAIEIKAEDWIASGRMPCLSLLVARHGRTVLHKTWGPQTSLPGAPPLSKEHIFFLASFSKVFTASVAMMLVDDGILSLNRPVNEYIPELCGEGTKPILVHHLLTHTSGFMDMDVIPEFTEGIATGEIKPAEFVPSLLQKIYRTAPRKKPLEQNIYSSVNIALVADIVQRLTGQTLVDITQQRLFEPLGMSATRLFLLEGEDEDVAFHPQEALTFVTAFWRSYSGAGGGFSHAGDLARFIQMFLNGGSYDGKRLLSRAAVHEMTRNQIPGIGAVNFDRVFVPEASWGLGWMVQGPYRWKYDHGALQPAGETFYHQGFGSTGAWGDKRHGIVGVYQSVTGVKDMTSLDMDWEFPAFQNMVTAAVMD